MKNMIRIAHADPQVETSAFHQSLTGGAPEPLTTRSVRVSDSDTSTYQNGNKALGFILSVADFEGSIPIIADLANCPCAKHLA